MLIGCRHSIQVKAASNLETRAAPDSAAFIQLSAGFQDSAAFIYGVTKKGAFVSQDAGANWQKCVLPGSGARVRAISTSLHHPRTAYLSYNHLGLDGTKWDGVAKTTDAGRTWNLSWKDGRGAAQIS